MITGTAAKAAEIETRYAIYLERKTIFGVTNPETRKAWNDWSRAISDLRQSVYYWTSLLNQEEEKLR